MSTLTLKTPTPTITITVAGVAGSGKSTVAYQIQRLFEGFGLEVQHVEKELNLGAVQRRLNKPLPFLTAIQEKKTKIIINEMNVRVAMERSS